MANGSAMSTEAAVDDSIRCSFVIPAYNEGDSIRVTIEEIYRNVEGPIEVIVVVDSEKDTTIPIIEDLQRTYPSVVCKQNAYGHGALNAIRTGLDSIRSDIAIVVMADFSDDFSAVESMLQKYAQGYDLVCGSRYMRGGKQIGGPFIKTLLSRTAGISLRYLAGIPTHDATNSFKLYSRRILENIRVESTGGFEIGMELVVKAHAAGFAVGEVPSTWRDRTEGQSRFRLLRWMPNYLRWYRYGFIHGNRKRLEKWFSP